jgi:shikimate kinase
MIKLKELVKTTIKESVYNKGLFKAIFTSGIPGAGKSYTLSKITDGNLQPHIVNTDKFFEFFQKKYDFRDIEDTENVDVQRLLVDISKKSTVNQLALYINSMLPLFVDGTSNNMSHLLRRDGILKSFGYDTGMVWINTDIDAVIKRMKTRERKVHENIIRRMFDSLKENMPYYKNHFAFFVELSNNDNELTDKIILDAYKKTSSFFTSDMNNPVGKRIYKIAYETSGYLVPSVYSSIEKIRSKLSGWY